MADSAEPADLIVKSITLVDSAGRRRATLGLMGDNEMPCLRLYGSDQCERIVIGLDSGDNPVISLLRADGKVAVGIGASSVGDRGVALYDSSGRPMATLESTDDDGGQLSVYDSEGELVFFSGKRRSSPPAGA